MYDKFLSLNKEKQDTIINASLKVFGNSPYKNASTDEIIKQARISKGSLFNYFKSKKDLYLFLYDYSIKVFMDDFYANIDLNERDIFKRLKNIVLVKFDIFRKYPDSFDFMIRAMDEKDLKVLDKIREKNNTMIMENYGKILGNIDTTNFREDIAPNKIIEMIIFTINGYGKQEEEVLKKVGFSEELLKKWIKELDEYMSIMKKLYYKGE